MTLLIAYATRDALADRWWGSTVGEFEQRQLRTLLRDELDLSSMNEGFRS